MRSPSLSIVRRRRRIAFLALVLASLATVAAQEGGFSPLERAQAENHLLKVQIAQLQATVADLTAQLQGLELTRERAALEQQFRETLQPPPGAVFDWQRLVFTTPAQIQEPPR